MIKSRYKNSDEDFIEAVKTSKSISEALKKLGLSGRGRNYDVFIKRCKELNINPTYTPRNKTGQSELRKTITDEEITSACSISKSKSETLRNLKLQDNRRGIEWVSTKIDELNIDASHFTGQLWSKGKTLPSRTDINDYFSGKIQITSHHLRLRLIKDGIFDHECSCCHLSDWLNEPIPLELDHINGNHYDNSLSNLRLLCPNCHSKTPTHRGKNKGKNV